MHAKYDPLHHEPRVRHYWQDQAVYATPHDAPSSVYTVDTPPPTVSGSLHIGHIFSYTQTDIAVRYQRMCGRPVFYPFGFDDNGLPTERFVEQKTGVTAQKAGRSAFIDACLTKTRDVEDTFTDLWQRMGLSADWDARYTTIGTTARTVSQASFLDLYRKGYIYRKEEPALYDVAYRTSVAQADLEDKEKETLFTDIAFTTRDGAHELVIGTTRPELLPSCVALLCHPDDARYRSYVGFQARVPIFDYTVPIIADADVAMDKGTGLVMCCTFGDKMDIEWYRRHNLPYRQSVGRDGRWVERTGPLAGLKVEQAREKMLELLGNEGVIRGQKTVTHVVSVYERSKKEIEYVMVPQWFLKILPFKQDLLDLAERITWHPPFMKARFIDWVSNLQWDWCLSRQRFFGIPFPIWYDAATGDVYTPRPEDLPCDPQEDAYPGEVPNGVELVPETDVMDTWNTSSLTPYICKAVYEGTTDDMFSAEAPSFLPMSMRPQAHDIIRTWAFYTMVKTWLHHGTIPWRHIVISGHVLSPESKKLSKSQGGSKVPGPNELLERYSADVVRYWTASGSLGYDVPFSENTLKIGRKLSTKLWNVARFAQSHISPKVFTPAGEPSVLSDENAWILHRISQVFERYQASCEAYECGAALQTLEEFFWNDVCDNYLEYIKPVLYADEPDEVALYATRWTLHCVVMRVVQLFAPFMPFITETIYHELFAIPYDGSSIHTTRFDEHQTAYAYPQAMERMAVVRTLISQVRKLKSDHACSLKTPLAGLTVVGDDACQRAIAHNAELVAGVAKAAHITYSSQTTGASFMQQHGEDWYATVVVA